MGLIKCKACSNEMAMDARRCPKCGAGNTFVHPEIERFLANLGNFKTPMSNYVSQGSNIVINWFDKGFLKPRHHMVKATVFGFSLLFLSSFKWFMATSNELVSGLLYMMSVLMLPGALLCFLYAGVGFLHFMLSSDHDKGDHRLLIDFSKEPLEWGSTDDKYWEELIRFFNLPPRHKDEKEVA